ncbi:MAG: AlkZ-related protein [Gaiellaceae bacterium]
MPEIEAAVAFVERVGIALVYPSADLVLPALWGAIGDPADYEWAVRDAEGNFVAFTEEFGTVWRWKDELPERRLACVGRHLGRFVAVIAPALVPAVYALRRDDAVGGLERELADALREQGPCGAPELRRLLGAEAKQVNRAVEALQRRCVLTSAGQVRQEHGWPAILLDLFDRRWAKRLKRLPEPDEARRLLATRVLSAADEASAADLAAALGWRQREAEATLAELAESGAARAHDDAGIAVYSL